MSDNKKQSYKHHYVNCIIQNNNLIEPMQSCQLSSSKRNNEKLINLKNNYQQIRGHSQHNLNFTGSKKFKIQSNKIFIPDWKTSSPDLKGNKKIGKSKQNSEQVVDMYLKKNEEIANSLMRQKKSMSDYVYNTVNTTKKIYRYLEIKSSMPSSHNNLKVQRQSKQLIDISECKGLNNNQNLPKIGRAQIQELKQQQKQQSEKSDIPELQYRSQNNIGVVMAHEPEYPQIPSINIQQFLKLKQQAYIQSSYDDNKYIAKKKTQSYKKKVAKRQKQKIKNSLQDFLQAKIIPKEADKQLANALAKNSNESSVFKILQRIRSNKRRQTSQERKQQQNNKKQQQQKERERERDSLTQQKVVTEKTKSPKKKIKVGMNAKFSQKFLFPQADASVYDNKIRQYRQFIFIMNMVHNIYEPVILEQSNNKVQPKYKYYVGKGNNRELIRALMKRRFWWIEVDDPMDANFVWTQLKINSYYCLQEKAERFAAYFYEQKQAQQKKKPINKKKNNQENLVPKRSTLFKAPLPANYLDRVSTVIQKESYQSFINQISQSNNPEKYHNFQNRKKFFTTLIPQQGQIKTNLRVHNHLENNFYIGNKKALFYNLKRYYDIIGKDVFNIVPLTFHINQQGVNDPNFKQFTRYFRQNKLFNKSSHNIWIIKPGQNSNRGNGITVCSTIGQISRQIGASKQKKQGVNTFIIQKYIEKPMLFKGRKFDIRHYMLATKINGKTRLYWYGEGYVRTSSRDFDLEDIDDIQIHLTNDAIQKFATSYGKFQQGNKISYAELQRYFDSSYPNRKYSIANQLYPKMKSIGLDAFTAAYLNMDPQNYQHNFEIFGLDFMIDANFDVWLIEVNTNPCLQTSSNILSRIVPNMLENSLRLTIDPMFPPNKHYPNTLKHYVPDNPMERLQFQLIFDEGRDGKQIQELFKDEQYNKQLQNLQQDQDTFDNDGKQGDFDIQ